MSVWVDVAADLGVWVATGGASGLGVAGDKGFSGVDASNGSIKCHVWEQDEQRNVRPSRGMAWGGTRNWAEHWGQ